MSPSTFISLPFSASKTVSWIHIGDTHLTSSGEQNEIDLGRIVDEINAIYADHGVDFVFVPGDIADDGSIVAYETFRKHMDRLKVPWCAIVGDHDVHEKSFENFNEYVAPELYSAFTIGPYRFFRLNAFSVPKPDSFVVDDAQLHWLDVELQECKKSGQRAVIFLHCYPSELKHGSDKVRELLQNYPVVLVDMGHTHYNEVSNDGKVLYSATRSTGQVEEGPVGYSVTTLSGDCMSWHFVSLDEPSLVAVTQPADERLVTERMNGAQPSGTIPVEAKIWSRSRIVSAHAELAGNSTQLITDDGLLWKGEIEVAASQRGTHDLFVTATPEAGNDLVGSVRIAVGSKPQRTFAPVDHDNAIGEWESHGLLGTQLGPNKNGRKW